MSYIYNSNGIIIYSTDPGEIVSRLLTRRPSGTDTYILLYRSSDYGFSSETTELNRWGQKAVIGVFKEIGFDVKFDETKREFIIQDAKKRFDFVLKNGNYSSRKSFWEN